MHAYACKIYQLSRCTLCVYSSSIPCTYLMLVNIVLRPLEALHLFFQSDDLKLPISYPLNGSASRGDLLSEANWRLTWSWKPGHASLHYNAYRASNGHMYMIPSHPNQRLHAKQTDSVEGRILTLVCPYVRAMDLACPANQATGTLCWTPSRWPQHNQASHMIWTNTIVQFCLDSTRNDKSHPIASVARN